VTISSASILSLVLAAISALQATLLMLSDRLFESTWHRRLSTYIMQDRDDELGMRAFFGDSPEGSMRSDVLVYLLLDTGKAVATLTTLLALVVASAASVAAALAANRDGIAWINVILTLLSMVTFSSLLVLAVQGEVYEYRPGVTRSNKPTWRKFVERRHPITLTFYRDVALVLSCLLIFMNWTITLQPE
jgi:hypothetical protein